MKLAPEKTKILLILVLLLLSLVFRELPYVNVLVAGKLWIFYGLLLLVLIFVRKIRNLPLVLLGIFFLFIAFLLTLFNLNFFAEILGLGIYFLLWLAVILKIIDFLK